MRDHNLFRPVVYLSGPITGVDLEQSRAWRAEVSLRLAPKIVCIDPTRDLVDTTVLSERSLGDSERLESLQHGRAVLERNRADIMRSDLVLVNLLGATKISIGSVGEVFWADALRKPVVLVREVSRNPHDHGLLNASASWVAHSLDDAIARLVQTFSA